MRFSRLLLAMLTLAFLAMGCSTTSNEDMAVDTAVFVVPEANHAWDYGTDVTADWPLEDSEYTYLRSEPDEGTAVWFDFGRGLEDVVPSALFSFLVDIDDDGSVVLRALADADGVESTFTPAVVLGPASWEEGESTSTQSTLDGVPVNWTVEFAERAEHEVHYGLFPDAIRLVVDDGGATPLGGTWWLGANAGLIQLDSDDDLLGALDLLTYR